MHRRGILGTLAATTWARITRPGHADAEEKTIKRQLVGAWTLVAVFDQSTDGKKNDPWGPGVQGSLMFSPTGRFSYFIVGANRDKAGNDPRNSPMGPIIGYFGTYTTDEGAKTLTFHIDRSTFPQWDGINRTANIETLTGDELKFAKSV